MPKTVLMITRAFYPSNASSVHRPVGFAKYLPEHGWTPIVLCKNYTHADRMRYDNGLAGERDLCEVVRVGHQQGRLGARLERCAWELLRGGRDEYVRPHTLYRRIKRKAEEIVCKREIDVIWSTYPPGLDHAVAAYLSRKYHLPWVADFRDLPDQTYDIPNTRYAVRREQRTCSTANSLIAVTGELAERLRQRHKAPVHTIFNGFDPDEYGQLNDAVEFGDKFTINHFGLLYSYRNPGVLFEALDRLIERRAIRSEEIIVSFYGASSWMVRRFSRGYRCASRVKTLGRLDYHEMIRRQKSSQILLLVTSPRQGGAIPGKLYGYLASRRPILNVTGDGMGTDRIVAASQAGISAGNPSEVAAWLAEAYQAWEETGAVPYEGRAQIVEKYSQRLQSAQLARVLNDASGRFPASQDAPRKQGTGELREDRIESRVISAPTTSACGLHATVRK